jgi:type II secretion system protein H
MPPRRARRPGFTIFELIVVLALLIILAAVAIPTSESLYGDSRSKAAADQVRGELAAARAWAIEEGRPYRVAVSDDGKRVRRAAEDEWDQQAGAEAAAGARRVEVALEKVTAKVQTDGDETPLPENGWVTVAVFLPDGTCRVPPGSNPTHFVALTEDGRNASGLRVAVRGLTGHTKVAPPPKTGGSP